MNHSAPDLLGRWTDVAQIFAGPSGYTSMCRLAAGRCGLVYERGRAGELPIQFESINFVSFDCGDGTDHAAAVAAAALEGAAPSAPASSSTSSTSTGSTGTSSIQI